jgi:hypothetical protein
MALRDHQTLTRANAGIKWKRQGVEFAVSRSVKPWFFALLLLATDPASFAALHERLLSRAHVWTDPAVPIESARLAENPAGPRAFARDAAVDCRFKPGGVSGTTPKFECELPNGDKVKVKYGASNPEVYTEVAATRLLTALGFPADRMYVVDHVRCFGCPKEPFAVLQCVNDGTPIERCFPGLDYTHAEIFDPAVIERPLEGRRVETEKERGWKWEELATIDAAAGGAPREHVDALRLLAVILGHWDNKADNQRLVCLEERDAAADCSRPFAMVQDLGATFGPEKLNLRNWDAMPVWTDASSCLVSMKGLPFGGSTFPDTRISEAGRLFLASRLTRLSHQQIQDLFEGARFVKYPHKDPEAVDPANWVRAFEKKVRAIADRAPCPAVP